MVEVESLPSLKSFTYSANRLSTIAVVAGSKFDKAFISESGFSTIL